MVLWLLLALCISTATQTVNSDKQNIFCEACPPHSKKRLFTYGGIIIHKHSKHHDGSFFCNVETCKDVLSSFKTVEELESHFKEHVEQYICHVCGTKVKDNKIIHHFNLLKRNAARKKKWLKEEANNYLPHHWRDPIALRNKKNNAQQAHTHKFKINIISGDERKVISRNLTEEQMSSLRSQLGTTVTQPIVNGFALVNYNELPNVTNNNNTDSHVFMQYEQSKSAEIDLTKEPETTFEAMAIDAQTISDGGVMIVNCGTNNKIKKNSIASLLNLI